MILLVLILFSSWNFYVFYFPNDFICSIICITILIALSSNNMFGHSVSFLLLNWTQYRQILACVKKWPNSRIKFGIESFSLFSFHFPHPANGCWGRIICLLIRFKKEIHWYYDLTKTWKKAEIQIDKILNKEKTSRL